MNTKTRKGPLLGLLAMFGAFADGTMPRLNASVKTGNRSQPQAVQDYLIARAKAKRERRAAKKAREFNVKSSTR